MIWFLIIIAWVAFCAFSCGKEIGDRKGFGEGFESGRRAGKSDAEAEAWEKYARIVIDSKWDNAEREHRASFDTIRKDLRP
jgi:hypothetical protein